MDIIPIDHNSFQNRTVHPSPNHTMYRNMFSLKFLFRWKNYLLILLEELVGELCEDLEERKVGRSSSWVIGVFLGGHCYQYTLSRHIRKNGTRRYVGRG